MRCLFILNYVYEYIYSQAFCKSTHSLWFWVVCLFLMYLGFLLLFFVVVVVVCLFVLWRVSYFLTYFSYIMLILWIGVDVS